MSDLYLNQTDVELGWKFDGELWRTCAIRCPISGTMVNHRHDIIMHYVNAMDPLTLTHTVHEWDELAIKVTHAVGGMLGWVPAVTKRDSATGILDPRFFEWIEGWQHLDTFFDTFGDGGEVHSFMVSNFKKLTVLDVEDD
jgi:hypothetical protein